jgi:hypothetical protein
MGSNMEGKLGKLDDPQNAMLVYALLISLDPCALSSERE